MCPQKSGSLFQFHDVPTQPCPRAISPPVYVGALSHHVVARGWHCNTRHERKGNRGKGKASGAECEEGEGETCSISLTLGKLF